MSTAIKVSEIFYSLQGEGKHLGTPSIFLRTFGCNFQCPGFGLRHDEINRPNFEVVEIAQDISATPSLYPTYKDLPLVSTGCDSYAAWHPAFKHLSPLMSISDIVDEIQKLLPNGTFSSDIHLVITGGEPLLGWQKSYPELFEEIHSRGMDLTEVTFETNGTQKLKPELIEYLNDADNRYGLQVTWSVSPKISSSGEKFSDAIKPDIVKSYWDASFSALYLKFVVANLDDVEEVELAVPQYKAALGFNPSVYLMSVGGTADVYNLHNKDVAQLAMKKGWKYSPRLQVELWKNAWAT